MPRKDPRVTASVAKAAPFARPILKAIRAGEHAPRGTARRRRPPGRRARVE